MSKCCLNCLCTPSNIRHTVESWEEVSEKPAAVRNRALSNVKILAVEDHEDTRLLFKAFLERSGADVIAVESGQAALLAIQRHKFDVVLCDIGMPERDGKSLLRQVRALREEEGGRVPAWAGLGWTRRAGKCGAYYGVTAGVRTWPVRRG